ncbi:meiosis-specific nuclear structural protein 1-like isoform X1 [Battus philenor]|uniref:meiosis-specific nuclear structural protein 1-like isoform X1 n=1 Tax=Battus philenor TaxID=42288 RepID=UPI0035D03011
MEPKNELQRNAIAEARRKELETYQRALDIQWLNSRMADSHVGRLLAKINQEAEMERDFQERTDHAALVNSRTEKEIALGVEVAKQAREEATQLLRRHYLREHDPALKTLLKKLQAGYVCKDLKQQILHNEYKRLQIKAEDFQSNRALSKSLLSDKEALKKEEKEAIDKKAKYCLEIQQQLVDREKVRQCQYEESLIEKKMLEDVMRTMADEDKRELQQKHEEMEKLRKEMVTFKKAREAWKEKQKKLLVIEERKIEQQEKEAGDRSLAIVAERERKVRERELLNEKIAAKIIADQAAIREREDMIKMLQEQEYLEKCVQDDIAERDKALRTKKDTDESLTQQMEMKKKLEMEQKKSEANFRKKSEAEMDALKQKDIEKELKLKQKQKQYCMDLKRQIEDNAKRRQKEKVREDAESKYVFDCEKAWIAETTQERNRIIEQHAPHLLGYLQPGVLVHDDLPYIKEGAQKDPELMKLDIDSIAKSKKPLRLPKCNSQCRILREF